MSTYARYGTAAAAFAALATLGAGTVAHAHHAFAAEFDSEAPVILKGPIEFIEWTNPHTWIHLKVPDMDAKGQVAKGVTYNWMVEGGTPNTLLRSGVDRNTLKEGMQIVVRGYQSKDQLCVVSPKTKKKSCKANGRDITFTNGCKVFMGSSGTGAPIDNADKLGPCAAPQPT